MREVGLVTNQRHDHAVHVRKFPTKLIEVRATDNPVFIPLKNQDLVGDLPKSRAQVKPADEIEAMGQRRDRRQAILLHVVFPTILDDVGKMALVIPLEDGLMERQA